MAYSSFFDFMQILIILNVLITFSKKVRDFDVWKVYTDSE